VRYYYYFNSKFVRRSYVWLKDLKQGYFFVTDYRIDFKLTWTFGCW